MMNNMMRNQFFFIVFATILVWSGVARSAAVETGTDYFTLGNDTVTLNFGDAFGGFVTFGGSGQGLSPDTQQSYDAAVARLETAVIDEPLNGGGDAFSGDSDTIAIQFAELSLASVSAVDVGGFTYDVAVSLTSGLDSLGSMTLFHDNTDDHLLYQGDYFFEWSEIYLTADFLALDGGDDFSVDGILTDLGQLQGSAWAHGEEDGDFNWNLGGLLAWEFNGTGDTDNGYVFSSTWGLTQVDSVVTVPEPVTLVLMAAALALVGRRLMGSGTLSAPVRAV